MNPGLSSATVQAIGWTLVHFLWQGAAIAMLLAAMLRLLRRNPAQHRYLASCAALALMATVPLVTLRVMTPRSAPSPVLAPAPTPFVPDAVDSTAPHLAFSRPPIVINAVAETGPVKFSARLESWFPWLVLGWLAGVCALSVRLGLGWLHVRRLPRLATQPLLWTAPLAAVARRLGVSRPVRLLQSALVEVPTVIGWLRPVILLPAACVAGLSPAQLEAIIAHELAHIRRHDYLVNLLQSAVETLLFYHSAVWWVSRRIREEREHCCDDLAVVVCGDRVGYARALATLEELRPASAQLALAAAGAPLLRRIRRLAGMPDRTPARANWPVAGIALLLLLGVVTLEMPQHRAVAQQHDASADPKTNAVSASTQPSVVTNIARREVSDSLSGSATNDPWGNPYSVAVDITNQNEAASLPQIGVYIVRHDFTENPAFTNLAAGIDAARALQSSNEGDGDHYFVTGSLNGFYTNEFRVDVHQFQKSVDRQRAAGGRAGIISKLHRIRLKNVAYSDVTLGEALTNLFQQIVARDPDGIKGVNFFLERFDTCQVKVHVALTDARAADVLDALVRTADQPIQYSVLDSAVEFSLRNNEPLPMETRTFHVDPNTFIQGLESVLGAGGAAVAAEKTLNNTNGIRFVTGVDSSTLVATAVRSFFQSAGVNLNSNTVVIFNDRKGTLIIRATPADLNLIESAIQSFNTAPPLINIKVKLIEVTQDPDLEVSLNPGNFSIGNDGVTNASGSNQTAIILSNGPIGRFTNAPIMPPPDQKAMRLIAYGGGVKVLADQNVTVENGRKVRIKSVDVSTVVYGGPGGYTTSNLEIGPTLEAVATVSSDSNSIQMTLKPSVTQFVGYLDHAKHPAGSTQPAVVAYDGNPADGRPPAGLLPAMPLILTSSMNRSVAVKDGQTVVLSGLVFEDTRVIKDKVPLLGDIPLMGRFFRSTSSQKVKKQLVIFVTPTLVNPDGTRVHADDEMSSIHPPTGLTNH